MVEGVWTERLDDLQNGTEMFDSCWNLKSFNVDLPSLTNGSDMFFWCRALTSFDSDLSSLTNGDGMFSWCEGLTSFNSDLPSLTNGSSMFSGCDNLASFASNLSSLTDGGSMFNGCYNLTAFTSDLSSLTDGGSMFIGCTKLTSFSSGLPSLTNGIGMFYGCKLNETSLQNIANTIKNMSNQDSPTIDLGLFTFNETNKNTVKQIQNKGWIVKCNDSDFIDNLGQDYKYDNCQTTVHIKMIDVDYLTNDIVDGTWSARLDDL